MLTQKNIDDIMNSIIRAIVGKNFSSNHEVSASFCRTNDDKTIASFSWLDKNNRIQTRTGIACKHNDKYSELTGKIIALIDILNDTRLNNSQLIQEFQKLKTYVISKYPEKIKENKSTIDVVIEIMEEQRTIPKNSQK